MASRYWDESVELDKLAELSIKTGVALQKGQDLLITAPLEAAPLVRRLAFHAYKQGCGIVTPLYTDPEVTLLRYQTPIMILLIKLRIGYLKPWARHLIKIQLAWLS